MRSVTKSYLTLCDPGTVDHQALLSMEFSRQKYWSRLPFPIPGDLTEIKLVSPAISCIGRQLLYHWATWEAHIPPLWLSSPSRYIYLSLTICGFRVVKLTYSLQFTCNPKINPPGAFVVIHGCSQGSKNTESLTHRFPMDSQCSHGLLFQFSSLQTTFSLTVYLMLKFSHSHALYWWSHCFKGPHAQC